MMNEPSFGKKRGSKDVVLPLTQCHSYVIHSLTIVWRLALAFQLCAFILGLLCWYRLAWLGQAHFGHDINSAGSEGYASKKSWVRRFESRADGT
jgi:hypothetical protein